MTEYHRSKLTLSGLFRKRIIADSNGGPRTSNGGTRLLREANRQTGLINA